MKVCSLQEPHKVMKPKTNPSENIDKIEKLFFVVTLLKAMKSISEPLLAEANHILDSKTYELHSNGLFFRAGKIKLSLTRSTLVLHNRIDELKTPEIEYYVNLKSYGHYDTEELYKIYEVIFSDESSTSNQHEKRQNCGKKEENFFIDSTSMLKMS